MRNENNKFNTETFLFHSPLQLSESSIMRNSKKGLFYSPPCCVPPHPLTPRPQWQRGAPLWSLTKGLLKLSPSFPHWVIGLESLSGNDFGNTKIKSTLKIILVIFSRTGRTLQKSNLFCCNKI